MKKDRAGGTSDEKQSLATDLFRRWRRMLDEIIEEGHKLAAIEKDILGNDDEIMEAIFGPRSEEYNDVLEGQSTLRFTLQLIENSVELGRRWEDVENGDAQYRAAIEALKVVIAKKDDDAAEEKDHVD